MNDLPDRLQRVIRQDVQSMHGYAVQHSAGMVKLDAMENPFRLPPDAAARSWASGWRSVAINRYPAERGATLRAALARHAGAAGRLRADARQRLRRADLDAGGGLRRAGRDASWRRCPAS